MRAGRQLVGTAPLTPMVRRRKSRSSRTCHMGIHNTVWNSRNSKRPSPTSNCRRMTTTTRIRRRRFWPCNIIVHSGGGTVVLYVVRRRGHVSAYAVNATSSSRRNGNTITESPPIRGTLSSSTDDDVVTADRDVAGVYVGTARGQVWRVHARAATHTLQCHEVTRNFDPNQRHGGGGLLKSLFSTGGGTAARRHARWNFPRIRSIAAGKGGPFWTVSGRDSTSTTTMELRHWRPAQHHDAAIDGAQGGLFPVGASGRRRCRRRTHELCHSLRGAGTRGRVARPSVGKWDNNGTECRQGRSKRR